MFSKVGLVTTNSTEGRGLTNFMAVPATMSSREVPALTVSTVDPVMTSFTVGQVPTCSMADPATTY